MLGRLIGQLGRPSRTRGEHDNRGSLTRYKAAAEVRVGAEGVGAGHSTDDRRDNITRRREGPALR
jgi:hypothetical protein